MSILSKLCTNTSELVCFLHRLNDMWTIGLQDREQACWEEVSFCEIKFKIKKLERIWCAITADYTQGD